LIINAIDFIYFVRCRTANFGGESPNSGGMLLGMFKTPIIFDIVLDRIIMNNNEWIISDLYQVKYGWIWIFVWRQYWYQSLFMQGWKPKIADYRLDLSWWLIDGLKMCVYVARINGKILNHFQLKCMSGKSDQFHICLCIWFGKTINL
jgi:hypothetical protein